MSVVDRISLIVDRVGSPLVWVVSRSYRSSSAPTRVARCRDGFVLVLGCVASIQTGVVLADDGIVQLLNGHAPFRNGR